MIADFEVRYRVALFDDRADELVPADETWFALQVATVVVQVAAAEGGAGDLENGVGGVLEGWIGAVLDGDLE